MGTDIGYLRFLFYFGIIGVIAFVAYFVKITSICRSRFSAFSVMFLMLLCVNLIGWCKVTTDVFLVFAPFLCVPQSENDEFEALVACHE